jgi:fructose-bisphosphate aldolase class II
LRLARTGAIRRFMAENPSKFDPRDYLKPAIAAAKKVCRQRYEQFGCAGMGSRIKAVPLDKMAARYKAGELAPVVQ